MRFIMRFPVEFYGDDGMEWEVWSVDFPESATLDIVRVVHDLVTNQGQRYTEQVTGKLRFHSRLSGLDYNSDGSITAESVLANLPL